MKRIKRCLQIKKYDKQGFIPVYYAAIRFRRRFVPARSYVKEKDQAA